MFNLVPTSFRRNLMYDPFKELDEFFATPMFSVPQSAFGTDIRHENGVYTLEADLPGVAKEDIDLEIKEGILTIKAERHSEKENEDSKSSFIRCERSYGSYVRSFDIAGIDADNITASFENGVLTLKLPEKKIEEPEVKKLSIA